MAVLGIHHFAMCVPDMERALEFYRDLLGFEIVDRAPIEPGPETSAVTGLTEPRADGVLLKAGWGYMELFEFQSPEPATHQFFWTPVHELGIRHFSLYVEDANAAYEYLRPHMIFHRAPVGHSVEGEDNEAWTTYGRDPFGNIIELWQLGDADPKPKPADNMLYPELSQKTEGAAAKAGILGLHHVALVVEDMDKAVEFYETAFGMKRVQEGPIEPSVYAEEVTQLPAPAAIGWEMESEWMYLELWQFTHPVSPAPTGLAMPNTLGLTHFSVMVDDCVAEYERLRSLMTFNSPPIQVGEDSYATYGRDPFGNMIELWQLGPQDPQPFAPAEAAESPSEKTLVGAH